MDIVLEVKYAKNTLPKMVKKLYLYFTFQSHTMCIP